MIEQTPVKKSLKAEVSYGNGSASIQTADTTFLDVALVAILVIGVITVVYLFKRVKK